MNLQTYFELSADSVSFTREKASLFAKSVARDFNPIHNPEARRFCVPGDLLFAVFLYRHGLSQAMHFDFLNMVDETVVLQQQASDDGMVLQDAAGRQYLAVRTSGESGHSVATIDSLATAYVQFSGQTFPFLLVELMKEHNVMINPSRPLVIYKSMELNLSEIEGVDISLKFSDATLDAEGKKAKVSLNFDIHSGDRKIGCGNKKMLLGGLRDYDQEVMDELVFEYNQTKETFLQAQSN